MLSPLAHHIGSRKEFFQEGAATVRTVRRLPSKAEPNLHPFPAILTTIFVNRHLLILPRTRTSPATRLPSSFLYHGTGIMHHFDVVLLAKTDGLL